jgi:hypothetical protein
MVAIPLGISPLHFGIYQTLSNRLFGYFLVIGALLLFLFTGHTDGFVVENGKNSRILRRQFLSAPVAIDCTGQLFFPGVFHVMSPLFFHFFYPYKAESQKNKLIAKVRKHDAKGKQ